MLKQAAKFWFFFLALVLGLVAEVWAKDEFIIHRTFFTPKGKIVAGGISKDGKYAYAIDKNNSIRVWHYDSGRGYKTIKVGTHKPLTSLFHPSKPLLITGGQDGDVIVWDIAKAAKLQTMTGHGGPVNALAITPDGTLLASGGSDREIILWKMDRYKIHKKIIEPSQKISSMDFHPSGAYLAWATQKGDVKIYDYNKDVVLEEYSPHSKKISQIKFHPLGDILATAAFDNKVVLYSWKQKQIMRTFEDHTKTVTGVDFDPEGSEMITCSMDGTILHSKLRSNKVIQSLNLVEKPVQFCEFSSDAKKILAVFEISYIRGWNLGVSSHMTNLEGHTKGILDMDISKNGSLMISVGEDNQIILWSLRKKQLVRKFEEPNHRAQSIRFHPDSLRFATGGSNSDIVVWDKDGKVLHRLTGHEGKINSLAFHPTEPVLISAGADKKIIYWDLKTGKKTFERQVHFGQIHKINFNHDGEYFATASQDKTVKIFRYFDQTQIHELKGHKKGVRDVAFAPGREVLASASDDKNLILWDTNTGKEIETMTGHEFVVSGLAFSVDGKTLVSGSRDKTVRLWDAVQGKFIRTMAGQKDQISSISVSSDGLLMASATIGNEISLLKLPKNLFRPFSDQANLPDGEEGDAGDLPPSLPQTSPTAPSGKTTTPSVSSVPGPDSVTSVPQTPAEPGILDKDVLEEDTGIKNDNVFAPKEEKKDLQLLARKKSLNQILKTGKACRNAISMEEMALEILKKEPQDQGAYYGLLLSSLVRQDLQMIYLAMKLGHYAKFDEENYDFQDKFQVKEFFEHWQNEVFDPSVNKKSNNITFEYIDCYNEIQKMEMPAFLLSLEMPDETVDSVIKGKIELDLKLYRSLMKQQNLFRDRIFALIYAVESGETRITETTLYNYIPNPNTYGYLELDMMRASQWGNRRNRLQFFLKKDNGEWLTYYANSDKTKSLLLPYGSYYLKFNEKLKDTFVIEKQDQKVKSLVD